MRTHTYKMYIANTPVLVHYNTFSIKKETHYIIQKYTTSNGVLYRTRTRELNNKVAKLIKRHAKLKPYLIKLKKHRHHIKISDLTKSAEK